ncbi:hypothetical protein RclHR1_30270001 [Rhizophagus clarus]|uniref:Uncharacterized protein n=1 Tax=Rhizophagus clarus TaxID=94130 RepID=A0A2Z6R9G8_9GLOM|nr:hypothetical protein RclHR1_30270001 [Rhizophagus clarus]
MVGWKYLKQRLQKHPYVAKVVRAKKVICICEAVIKLNRKFDKDYINRHANNPGCKRKDEQRSILCFFAKSITDKDVVDDVNSDDDWDNWESEVEDTMNDDDIITIDEAEDEISEKDDNIIINPTYINQVSNKRKGCLGLCSDLIIKYVDRIPASYSGAHQVEKIYAESQWRVDKDCVAVRSKHVPVILKKGFITLVDKAIHGVFNEKPVFEGLCEVIVQAIIRKDNNKGKQNIKYNEEFTNFFIILESFSTQALDIFCQNLEGCIIQNICKLRANNKDTLTNPTFSFENIAKFKRLIDILNYQGPIAAMSDNTKLKPALCYHSGLGCIIRLTLSIEETKINDYKDIPIVINDIKMKKVIAKDVLLLPNFPPVVIALITNTGSDSQSTVTNFHQELLIQMASRLNLSILSIGLDGHIVKFKAQIAIQRYQTNKRLIFQNNKFGINLSCPVFPNVEPVVCIQDPKHIKKTSRNAIMSGARLLTFGNSTVWFEQLLKLSNFPNLVMYHHDVIKLNRQDDGAAYRVFCLENLQNCYNVIKEDMRRIFIYLFIMG